MIDVVILYEHKARELESILLLKYVLEKRGLTVEIFHTDQLDRLKYFYRGVNVVVSPFFYSERELHYYICDVFGKKKKVCNLQWEQVYTGLDTEEKAGTPRGIACEGTHICWGQKSFERLKEAGVKNAVLTGPIHLDFLKSKFDKWYMNKEEVFKKYEIDTSKRTFLFISSFSVFGMSDKQLDAYKSLVNFDIYEYRDITTKTRTEVLSWFEKMLEDNSDINIIYRPHPGENGDERLYELCKKNNFYCISDYSVKQWIKISDVVLNWNSTSGVETYFCGKETLFLRPYKIPVSLDYQMYSNVCTATSYEQLDFYLNNENEIHEFYLKNPLKYTIGKYYENKENSYSYKKICDLIEEMVKSEEYNLGRYQYSFVSRLWSHYIFFVRYILYYGWKNKNRVIEHLYNNSARIKNIILRQEKMSEEWASESEIEIVYDKLSMILSDSDIK